MARSSDIRAAASGVPNAFRPPQTLRSTAMTNYLQSALTRNGEIHNNLVCVVRAGTSTNDYEKHAVVNRSKTIRPANVTGKDRQREEKNL